MIDDALLAKLRITIAPDNLSARLIAEGGLPQGALNEGVIRALLAGVGIPVDEDRQARIRAALAEHAGAPAGPIDAIIAVGTPTVHGEDGSIQALDAPPTSRDTPGPSSHYERRVFTPVKAGDVIGIVRWPRQGSDGVDVRGAAVLARPPREFTPKFGEGVRIEGCRIIAVRDGLPDVSRRGADVIQTLQIDSRVDFATGNVDFPGDLEITKGVADRFVVTAGRDLHIRGLVEGASIRAGRDAHLHAGMSGRSEGSVKVGGSLAAKYLDAVRGDIGVDLLVENEIAASELAIGRRLVARDCTVTGGELFLTGGGEVLDLGNDAGVQTSIVLGRSRKLEDILPRALRLRETVVHGAHRDEERLAQLRAATGRLTPTQAEQLTELQYAAAAARIRLAAIDRGLERMLRLAETAASSELLVLKAIHLGVTIWIGGYKAQPRQTIKGPVHLLLDDRGTPCLRPGHGDPERLTSRARVTPEPRFVDLAAIASHLRRESNPVARAA